MRLGSPRHYRGAHGIQPGHVWLCAGPVILRCLDYGLTLFGQPDAYWAGDFMQANEGSPLLLWCLQQHPLLFVGAAAGLTVLFSLFILCWPREPARLLSTVLTFAHLYGVASWVFPSMICGPAACVALLYFCASLTETAWRRQLGAAAFATASA
jgi:hypothetical protein